jgi:hypothetical protein
MNLSLVDPFVLAQDYPDTLTEKLRMWFIGYLKMLLHVLIGIKGVAMRHVCDLTTLATT